MKAITTDDGIYLDPLTAKLFKRQRRARALTGEPMNVTGKTSKGQLKMLTKMSEQDRGRIRRLKQKVWLLLKRKSNFKLQLVNHSPDIAAQIAYYSQQLPTDES